MINQFFHRTLLHHVIPMLNILRPWKNSRYVSVLKRTTAVWQITKGSLCFRAKVQKKRWIFHDGRRAIASFPPIPVLVRSTCQCGSPSARVTPPQILSDTWANNNCGTIIVIAKAPPSPWRSRGVTDKLNLKLVKSFDELSNPPQNCLTYWLLFSPLDGSH